MENALYIIIPIIVVAVVIILFVIRRVVIFEYDRGLLYRQGKFIRILIPGAHYLFRPIHTVRRMDVRFASITLPGQELLTSDNVSIKISLAARFRVSDAYLALNKVTNYQEALYLLLQLSLRDLVGSIAVDDLLAKRGEVGKQIFEQSSAPAAEIGIELNLVSIKDIMFPGELKNIFAQVVNARKEGLAAFRQAPAGRAPRCATWRTPPSCWKTTPISRELRLFQVLEKHPGNTIVIMPPDGPMLKVPGNNR